MKIVIIGGGTAGWISALMISKVFENIHDVTLVESSQIGSIGVGEGSTGFLRGIVNNEIWNLGSNPYDFMKFTKATPKLGVLFKDWKNLGHEYFEPIDGSFESSVQFSDPVLLDSIVNDSEIHLSSINGNFFKNKTVPFLKNSNGEYGGIESYAYHFDAKSAAKYFESLCAKNVKKIVEEIVDVELSADGSVRSIILKNSEKIYADFFIDASGFKRIFAEKMNVPFIPYKELTLNSAIPFVLDKKLFSNKNTCTVSWAKKYGWMWMIPKTDVIGCGYIYDDNYINDDDAKKEVEKDLGIEIEVIKNIKFVAGRQKTAWNKNVLSVGLSSHFLEPLEATSIHGTIAQINNFVFSYLKNDVEGTINQTSIKKYNEETEQMIENFKDFILFHYSSTRSDTKFWINMQKNAENNSFINKVVDISKTRLLNEYDFFVPYGGAGHPSFNWIVAALGHMDKTAAIKEFKKPKREDESKKIKHNINNFMYKNNWETSNNFINFLERGR